MKRRKLNKKLIIVLLILFISIGFAYLTSNLNLTGLAILKRSVWDVHFENIVNENINVFNINTPAVISNNTLRVDFEVTLDQPGEEYSFYVDVVNNSTFDVTLDTLTIEGLTPDQEYWITPTVTYSDGITPLHNDILKENTKETLRVSVKYNDNIITLPSEDEDFDITVQLKYNQADSNSRERTHLEYVNRQNSGVISTGDEIAIGTEHFYVVSSNEETTVLYAKQRLNVGRYKDLDQTVGIQLSLHIATAGLVSFSNTKYWYENGNFISEYGIELNRNNIYDTNYNSESGNNYSVAFYVENYVNYLNSLGLNNIVGRLLTYSEVVDDFGIPTIGGTIPDSVPIWLYKPAGTWLSSVKGNDGVWYLSSGKKLNIIANNYGSQDGIGVRPVIEIPTTALSGFKTITFDPNGGTMVSDSLYTKKVNTTLEDDYYIVYHGPDANYANHNNTTVSVITDGEYENVYRIDGTNPSTSYSGVYWNKAPLTVLPMGEDYRLDLILRGSGRWRLGYEQGPGYFEYLTDDYKDYNYKFKISTHYARAIIVYESSSELVYVNIRDIQLTHLMPEATRTGYMFDGWYTDPVEGVRVDKDTVVTDNVTYYAHWFIPIVNVNLFVDGVQIDSQNYTGNLSEQFKYSVYINDVKVANQVNEYTNELLYGTTYQVTDLIYDSNTYELDNDFKPSFNRFNNSRNGTISKTQHNNSNSYKYIDITVAFKTKSQ